MAWTKSDLTVGRVIYWLATVIAALVFVFVVGDFFIGWAQGTPIVRVFALAAAVLIWLIGLALRPLPS